MYDQGVSAREATQSSQSLDGDLGSRVRAETKRVLSSRAFRQVDSLKRLLSFLVDETLAGRGEQLKEIVVGLEVFAKDGAFNPRNDPIVRVQARHLRTRLARYYREEGKFDELQIEIPKGGYAPVFKNVKQAALKRLSPSLVLTHNTVAVLPFSDDSRQKDHEYFCRGLVQEIIQALAHVKSVRLIAWTGSESFERDEDARSRAESLNISILVCGSVRASGHELRIAVHLVDVATGSYLFSQPFQYNGDDIFTIQAEIANAVAARIKSGMPGMHQPKGLIPTTNLAAFNFCMQGRFHLNQRTEDGLRKAVDFFEKALVEDSQYALAYSGLADACKLLGHYGVFPPAEMWIKAASNAAAAVLANENSAEARASLAHVRATQDWDWEGAEREFRRSIALDPRYATAHHWYAMSCLIPFGRLDEAVAEMSLAQDLDPISSIISRDLALLHYYRRDFESALEQCDHTIGIMPYFAPAYGMLGLVQEQLGDFDESAAAFNRAQQIAPNNLHIRAALGRLCALSGKQREAREIREQLAQLAETQYLSPFHLAILDFSLNAKETGFQHLARAFENRCFELTAINIDPRLDPMRSCGEFDGLVSRLHLPPSSHKPAIISRNRS